MEITRNRLKFQENEQGKKNIGHWKLDIAHFHDYLTKVDDKNKRRKSCPATSVNNSLKQIPVFLKLCPVKQRNECLTKY